MAHRTRDPGMMDVARLAGVSHQTVSRVLNDHPNVTERTRMLVRAAIAELGYRPNRAARALATGRTQVIGVVTQSSTLYGPASTLSSFAEAAIDAGFTVSVESVRSLDREPMQEAVSRHLDQRVAGLVIIAPVESAGDVIGAVPGDMPLVCIDGDPRLPTDLITVDQEAGGYAATSHLLRAGHKTVWHVAGPKEWFDSRGRIEGWRRALTEANADIPPPIQADWSASSGYQAGQLLGRMPDVTAIFAANDHLALGLLRALHEQGRRVPEDVSLVGFDDLPEAEFFTPPLTTIRPDFAAVAVACLEMLLSQFESGQRSGRQKTIAPMLIPRSSVASPRRLT